LSPAKWRGADTYMLQRREKRETRGIGITELEQELYFMMKIEATTDVREGPLRESPHHPWGGWCPGGKRRGRKLHFLRSNPLVYERREKVNGASRRKESRLRRGFVNDLEIYERKGEGRVIKRYFHQLLLPRSERRLATSLRKSSGIWGPLRRSLKYWWTRKGKSTSTKGQFIGGEKGTIRGKGESHVGA